MPSSWSSLPTTPLVTLLSDVVDAFRLAFDETWRWAERRGVRVDFWKNDDAEWEAMITLRDANGEFSGSMVLPLHRPTKAEKRRHTIDDLRSAYIKALRSLLDGLTASARMERNVFQRRRLQ